eukprot:GFYU01012742.1.p1 GENE.GFYU01012742.1~~GFYU01012742.1.p1  ORF type:complete len:342 (+),score=67.52 GFYU01012742.1:162-1187(+)
MSYTTQDIQHRVCSLNNGLEMHIAHCGNARDTSVILVHGWPELWKSWEAQIPAIANAGFYVIAPDMRGFGETSAPNEIEAYSQEHICSDVAALQDHLGIKSSIVIGHDWGGMVVWNFARSQPQRVLAVAGVNTPYVPRTNTLEDMKKNPGRFDYQLYFQDPGVAEKEFESDIRKTFTVLIRGSKRGDRLPNPNPKSAPSRAGGITAAVRDRGGMLVGAPADLPRSVILTEEKLDYLVDRYSKSGFRGGLNWYRNMDANCRWHATLPAVIEQPALMVTAGKDAVLLPAMSKGMERVVPRLTRAHIELCGHWTQLEQPQQLNTILVEWLQTLSLAGRPRASKL